MGTVLKLINLLCVFFRAFGTRFLGMEWYLWVLFYRCTFVWVLKFSCLTDVFGNRLIVMLEEWRLDPAAGQLLWLWIEDRVLPPSVSFLQLNFSFFPCHMDGEWGNVAYFVTVKDSQQSESGRYEDFQEYILFNLTSTWFESWWQSRTASRVSLGDIKIFQEYIFFQLDIDGVRAWKFHRRWGNGARARERWRCLVRGG